MKNKIKPELIPEAPVGISIYSVSQQAPYFLKGFMEIIYCFKGTVAVSTKGQSLTLHEGDIISCDPLDIRYMSCDEENLLVSFYFDLRDPVFQKENLEHIYFICEPLATPVLKQPELQNLKRQLLTLLYFYCFPHPKLNWADIANRLAVNIVNTMLDHFHYFDFINYSMDFSDEMKERFEEIMIYIDKNYSTKITLGKLCELYHFNYKYLSHFFKKTSFVGFPKFIANVRGYHASCLLLETNKNISDIAYETGFSSPLYYYQNSRFWTEMTPNQYRKAMRELEVASVNDVCYDVLEKKEELKHFISLYFAVLQVPDLWLEPFVPRKGLPEY